MEEHKCKYCGAVTTQPDEECYKKPASPPSMPDDDAVKCALNEYVRYLDKNEYRILAFAANDFKAGANFMRSQCEGLIKQKAVEFLKWKEKLKPRELITVHDDGQTPYVRDLTEEELYEIFNPKER